MSDTVQVKVRMRRAEHARLKAEAERCGVTLSAMILMRLAISHAAKGDFNITPIGGRLDFMAEVVPHT